MRVFAVSDVHIDYDENARWLANLSETDYRRDVLMLAGDVSDSVELLEWGLRSLASRFHRVVYVPGNHDLWVRHDRGQTSIDKFHTVCAVAARCGVATTTLHCGRLSIVPLLGWYDYSFGMPAEHLHAVWMDYRACVWPGALGAADITSYF